jgi:hypothetical protein
LTFIARLGAAVPSRRSAYAMPKAASKPAIDLKRVLGVVL